MLSRFTATPSIDIIVVFMIICLYSNLMLHVSVYYICLLARLCKSKGTTLGIIGDSADAIITETEEVEETPQGVVEWTPNVVMYTSCCAGDCYHFRLFLDVDV